MPEDHVTLWFMFKVGIATALCTVLFALLSLGLVAIISSGQNAAVRFVARLLRRKT
jgi:hypothetical protein